MRKALIIILPILFWLNCGSVNHFYHREGWSYSYTKSQFEDRLIVAEKKAVKEKVEPNIPAKMKIRGKASVKVLIDPDGKIVAAAIKKTIEGLDSALIEAAKKTEYHKIKDHLDRRAYYVTILEYIYR